MKDTQVRGLNFCCLLRSRVDHLQMDSMMLFFYYSKLIELSNKQSNQYKNRKSIKIVKYRKGKDHYQEAKFPYT
jgi:hypothetical protein